MHNKHSIPPACTEDDAAPRPPLARRTYDNIYSLFAHDPDCRCCHPNDRPYCPCACHSGVSRGEARLRAVQLRREEIPNEPRIGQRPAERRPDPRLAGMPGKAAS